MTTISDDIATELGRTLTDTEAAQAAQWITDARLLVRARLGDPDLLDQDVLDYVIRQAVSARFRNPEGYQSETIDDYTYRYGTETRTVQIRDEWWDLLSPDSPSVAFSTRPGFEPDAGPFDFLPVIP